jgi:2-polyprenyl-6-methoxyphenol hydroxylase-like FAD-dependent oxidoreductase
MHPVTAHGFILGLSGQEILAKEIINAAAQQRDIGAIPLLERYHRKHIRTTRPMFYGTNEIVKFFTDDRVPAKLARRVALRLANRIPPIKRAIQNKLTEMTNSTNFLPRIFKPR